MCEKCLRYYRKHRAKSMTYGQIKAIAHSVTRSVVGMWRLPKEHSACIGIEAHIHRIERARTFRRYDRKNRRKEIASYEN